MRMRLPESERAHTRKSGGTTASIALHVALVAAAVVATRGGAAAREASPNEPLIYTEPAPRTSARLIVDAEPPPDPPASLSAADGRAPHIYLPPVSIPTGIPVVDPLAGAVVDLTAHAASAVAGSEHGARTAARVDSTVGFPRSEFEVDLAVRPLGRLAPPRYPEALRAQSIGGRVVVEFVVDTLGRVEPGTVRVAEASESLFARAVHDVLPRYRFAPAEAAGRRVRQLVRMPFTFTVDR